MHSTRPLISVIVTCFNYARYVGRAIESALAQRYDNVEVIVVNDGSQDDSLAIISGYAGRVVVVDQSNQGATAAYNAGFKACSGEIVVLLDADDWLEPEALSRVVAVWAPEVAKVQWELKIVDAQSRDLGRKFCHFDGGYDSARVREAFERTGTYRWPVSVGNAYARWFAERVFPLSPEHGPDGALNSVAPLYGSVITIPEVLAAYRIHGKNTWSVGSGQHARLPTRISQRLAELQLMRRHAAERGVGAPRAYPLDHEIAFLNYRLMAKKLGLSYSGCQRDTAVVLWWRAIGVLRRERYPLRLSLSHALWFSTLSVSPKLLARQLIALRFQRGAWQGALARLRQDMGTRLRRSVA